MSDYLRGTILQPPAPVDPMAATLSVLAEVCQERRRQDQKWGIQRHTPARWMTILGEEYGEACRGAYAMWHDGDQSGDYRAELLHTAAVCVAAIECYDRQAGRNDGTRRLP